LAYRALYETDGKSMVDEVDDFIEEMTLLDYFAGEALKGLSNLTNSPKHIAKSAYDMAEAMMAERKKRMEDAE
jgi:hypothetical protein